MTDAWLRSSLSFLSKIIQVKSSSGKRDGTMGQECVGATLSGKIPSVVLGLYNTPGHVGERDSWHFFDPSQ